MFNLEDKVFSVHWDTKEIFETEITGVIQHYDGFNLIIDKIKGHIFETICDRLGPVPGMSLSDLDGIEKGHRYYRLDECPGIILDKDELFLTREEAELAIKEEAKFFIKDLE